MINLSIINLQGYTSMENYNLFLRVLQFGKIVQQNGMKI